MSLRPTRTRLRRLAEVQREEIARCGDGHDYDARGYKVDHAMSEMAHAGWVRLGIRGPGRQRWELTTEGARVLASAGRRGPGSEVADVVAGVAPVEAH